MWKQNPCTVIDVDAVHQKVTIDNKTDDVLHRAFGVVEEPTWNDFQNFLEDRCFPVSRGDGKWIKQDQYGYEGLASATAYQLLRRSNMNITAACEVCAINVEGLDYNGCKVTNFLQPDEDLITLEQLHRKVKGVSLQEVQEKVPDVRIFMLYVVTFVKEFTKLSNFGAYLAYVLEADAFLLKEDRNFGNLAVIRNEKTGAFRLCPIYDFGRCLLSDLENYPMDSDIESCVGRMEGKPFSTDLNRQKTVAEEMFGQQLRLRFTQMHVQKILEEIQGNYDADILRRIGQIVYQQSLRYPLFFQQV